MRGIEVLLVVVIIGMTLGVASLNCWKRLAQINGGEVETTYSKMRGNEVLLVGVSLLGLSVVASCSGGPESKAS